MHEDHISALTLLSSRNACIPDTETLCSLLNRCRHPKRIKDRNVEDGQHPLWVELSRRDYFINFKLLNLFVAKAEENPVRFLFFSFSPHIFKDLL